MTRHLLYIKTQFDLSGTQLFFFFLFCLLNQHKSDIISYRELRAKYKTKHKVLQTQKNEHPRTCSYIPFLDLVGCVNNVLQVGNQVSILSLPQQTLEHIVFSKQDFCSVEFMFLHKSLFIYKRFTFTITSDVKMTTKRIRCKTQSVLYKFNSTTRKTYVQPHIKHVEPYTAKLTLQIISINTRFNITIIC